MDSIFDLMVFSATVVIFIAIAVERSAKKQRKLYEQKLIQSDITSIDSMKGVEFEHYLKALFQELGFKAQVTQSTNDYGADLLLISPDGEKIVIQAKRYSKNVGVKSVQEIYGSMPMYSANSAWVVTNSHFTKNAHTLANSVGVKLIGRAELIDLILQSKNTNDILKGEMTK